MTTTNIGTMLIEICRFHIMFCLICYLVIIGLQWIVLSNLKRNLAAIRYNETAHTIFLNTKMPPIDGWVATFLISFVPLLNVLYCFFILKLGIADADSDFIALLQNEYTDIQKDEEE